MLKLLPLSERRPVDVMPFWRKAFLELLNGQTSLIVASQLQEPGPVNPSEMPNSCRVVVGKRRAGLMLARDVKRFRSGLGTCT